MSVSTPKTMRSRTITHNAARMSGYTPPRCPRGRTSRRAERSAAVTSTATSKRNSTNVRVTLLPLARNAR